MVCVIKSSCMQQKLELDEMLLRYCCSLLLYTALKSYYAYIIVTEILHLHVDVSLKMAIR